MKRLILASALAVSAASAGAQAIVRDTVSVCEPAGSVNYPNQVWYSLAKDVQGSAPCMEWLILPA